VNVCIMSLLLASQLKMTREQLVVVGLAGLLHDIGKVRVPHAIISKPAKLTPDEMEIVKRHTIYGAHILRDVPDISRLAMVVAFEHHAGFNLSGYPRIAAKKMPNLITRIVFVADCFDAMTSTRRLYRDPKRIDQALKEILDGAGTAFDPLLAKLFCKNCRTFLAAAEQERRRLDGPAPAGAPS
jgi:HD-GYP domain-containing protein (c-di-GMP phosphodiesterase class II)